MSSGKKAILTKFLTSTESERLGQLAQTILNENGSDKRRRWSYSTEFSKLPRRRSLSFYDASYIYFAKEKGLILVTEDKKLGLKASRYAEVQTVSKLLSK